MKTLILTLCLLPFIAGAHSHDKSLTGSAKAAAQGAVKAVTTAVVSAAVAAPGAIKEGAEATTKIDFVGIMKSSFSNHRHSKVVHFPIALGLVAVLFGLMSYKFESFKSSTRWLLFLAALSSIVAILLGRAEEDSVEGAIAKQVMEAHEFQGYAACIALWLNWLVSFFEPARKWSWVLLLLLAAILVNTGMLGGALAHMQF